MEFIERNRNYSLQEWVVCPCVGIDVDGVKVIRNFYFTFFRSVIRSFKTTFYCNRRRWQSEGKYGKLHIIPSINLFAYRLIIYWHIKCLDCNLALRERRKKNSLFQSSDARESVHARGLECIPLIARARHTRSIQSRAHKRHFHVHLQCDKFLSRSCDVSTFAIAILLFYFYFAFSFQFSTRF